MTHLISASSKAERVEKAGFETIYLNSQQLLSSAALKPLAYSLQVICKQPGKGLFVLTKWLGDAYVGSTSRTVHVQKRATYFINSNWGGCVL